MKLLAIIEVEAASEAEAQEKLDSFRTSVADELIDRGISIYRPPSWLRVPEGNES